MPIIAEFCMNHMGQMSTVKSMVEATAKARAWSCKIQTFFAEDLDTAWRSEHAYYKSVELSWKDHQEFVDLCKKNKIEPMTSVYTSRYIPELSEIGFKYIKIGSADNHKEDMIRKYILAGFKVIMSTGGTPFEKIPKINGLEAVLVCRSKYPHAHDEVKWGRLLKLARLYPNISYGLSDHTAPLSLDWMEASKLAITMGSKYIERHFTILPRKVTKDGKVSIDESQLRALVQFDNSFNESYRDVPAFEEGLIDNYRRRWKV